MVLDGRMRLLQRSIVKGIGRGMMTMADERPAPTINGRVDQLLSLLDLKASGELLFTGGRQPGGEGRVFGGQVIAQGLVAAMRTVEPGRLLHSLHAYFMRAGDDAKPIDYQVRQDFDGGSFSTRRIIALQEDRPILTMTASFHRLEKGLEHQAEAMPDVPPPEELISEIELIQQQEKDPARAEAMTRFQSARPMDVRPVTERRFTDPQPMEPVRSSWIRLGASLDDFPRAAEVDVGGNADNLHRAILAYASDMMLLGTSSLAHGVNWTCPGFMEASLDHSLWIHDDFRADEWLLYHMDSPWSGRGRGFNRGRFFSRDGRLVASVAQEGLMRYRPPVA
jgi:acyl-CoA thioesterase-2